MSDSLIYIILFALLMFFMHRGHGVPWWATGVTRMILKRKKRTRTPASMSQILLPIIINL